MPVTASARPPRKGPTRRHFIPASESLVSVCAPLAPHIAKTAMSMSPARTRTDHHRNASIRNPPQGSWAILLHPHRRRETLGNRGVKAPYAADVVGCNRMRRGFGVGTGAHWLFPARLVQHKTNPKFPL